MLIAQVDLDQDGSGDISLEEFLIACRVRLRAAEAFASSDPAVAAAENAWAKILFLHSQKEGSWLDCAGAIFADFDADGAGVLDKVRFPLSEATAFNHCMTCPPPSCISRAAIFDVSDERLQVKLHAGLDSNGIRLKPAEMTAFMADLDFDGNGVVKSSWDDVDAA